MRCCGWKTGVNTHAVEGKVTAVSVIANLRPSTRRCASRAISGAKNGAWGLRSPSPVSKRVGVGINELAVVLVDVPLDLGHVFLDRE